MIYQFDISFNFILHNFFITFIDIINKCNKKISLMKFKEIYFEKDLFCDCQFYTKKYDFIGTDKKILKFYTIT